MAVPDYYLSPWNDYSAYAPIVQVGQGRTIRAKLCDDYEGDPAPISGALDIALVEGPTDYPLLYWGTFESSDLLAAGLNTRIGEVIAVHFYNSTGFHVQKRVAITASRES